jgi:TolA-binding protein
MIGDISKTVSIESFQKRIVSQKKNLKGIDKRVKKKREQLSILKERIKKLSDDIKDLKVQKADKKEVSNLVLSEMKEHRITHTGFYRNAFMAQSVRVYKKNGVWRKPISDTKDELYLQVLADWVEEQNFKETSE